MIWGLIQLSSAIEDQHGMDTTFYYKHKIHSFLAILQNRRGFVWLVFSAWRKDYILTSQGGRVSFTQGNRLSSMLQDEISP